MINARLITILEKIFKQDPFNLENTSIVIKADRGTITVEEQEPSESIEILQEEIGGLEDTISDLNGKIDEYEFLMDSKDIDYE